MVFFQQFGGAVGGFTRWHQADHIGAGGGRHRLAHDMETFGDQRPFGFQQLQPERVDIARVHIDRIRLIADQLFKIVALAILGQHFAPAFQAVLEVDQTLVQPRCRQRRRQMSDRDRIGPALGQ